MKSFKKFNELDYVKKMPAEKREQLRRDAIEEYEIVTGLAELRRKLEKTQTEIAEATGVKQPQISKIEQSNDNLLSTLRRYVNALGGRLEINVVVDGQRFGIDFTPEN